MSFFKEIADALNAAGTAGDGYNVIDYGGEAIYIEGVRRILSIEPVSMRFDCKKKILSVTGENLRVSQMEDGCVVVVGKVTAFAAEDVHAH